MPDTASNPAVSQRPVRADDWDAHWEAFSSAAERNPAQEYRRRLIMRLLERNGPPQRLLDIGSGQGDFLRAARARWPQADLAGLEASKQGARETQAKLPGVRITVRDLLVAEEPPGAIASWATHAVCSEVLEHVDDPARLLEHARAYLAPSCVLVVTVPGGPMSAFDRHIGHRRHYTPESVAALLERAGLEVTHTAGAGFPFFNLYRTVVIARGERLVADLKAGTGSASSRAASAAMRAFRVLFRLNLPSSPWGMQVVAVARVPAGDA